MNRIINIAGTVYTVNEWTQGGGRLWTAELSAETLAEWLATCLRLTAADLVSADRLFNGFEVWDVLRDPDLLETHFICDSLGDSIEIAVDAEHAAESIPTRIERGSVRFFPSRSAVQFNWVPKHGSALEECYTQDIDLNLVLQHGKDI